MGSGVISTAQRLYWSYLVKLNNLGSISETISKFTASNLRSPNTLQLVTIHLSNQVPTHSSMPTLPDPEKGLANDTIITVSCPTRSASQSIPFTITIAKLNDKIESLSGFEARGITRVLPCERHNSTIMSDLQMAFLWFSANISANNLAVGFLGPLVFQLGFLDSAFCSVFGALVGSIMTAYMSTWGPESGNRTLVLSSPLDRCVERTGS